MVTVPMRVYRVELPRPIWSFWNDCPEYKYIDALVDAVRGSGKRCSWRQDRNDGSMTIAVIFTVYEPTRSEAEQIAALEAALAEAFV